MTGFSMDLVRCPGRGRGVRVGAIPEEAAVLAGPTTPRTPPAPNQRTIRFMSAMACWSGSSGSPVFALDEDSCGDKTGAFMGAEFNYIFGASLPVMCVVSVFC